MKYFKNKFEYVKKLRVFVLPEITKFDIIICIIDKMEVFYEKSDLS